HQLKIKILFGLSDAVLTAAAFEIAYALRKSLPFQHNFFLPPDTKALLLGFSVLAWVTVGYWLNVNARIDSARIRTILRECLRQVAYSSIALVLFLVFGHALENQQLARSFLALFIVSSWLFLASFRISTRNLVPLLGSGTQRHVLIVGMGPRAERLARNLETYHEQGIRVTGFLAPPGDPSGPSIPDPSGQSYP